MTISIHGAGRLSLEQLSDLFNAGFQAYLAPVTQSPEAMGARIRTEQIDLHWSRVALLDDRPAGLCLLAVRGRRVRVAAMGVTLDHRGRGVGRALLEAALDVSSAAGARLLLLEVIAQNRAALALYQSGGFTATRRLVGRIRPPVDASPAPEHRLTDVEELARALMAEPDLPWPWQMEPASVTSLPGSFEVHALGPDAFACVQPAPHKLVLRHLVVRPPARRRGLARRLLASIQARHPQASWSIPPLVPEGLAAPALDALGFGPAELSQLEMERPLP